MRRLIAIAERGMAQARAEVQRLEKPLRANPIHWELERVEAFIRDMSGAGGFLSVEEGRELADAKEFRRQLRRELEEMNRPRQERADQLRPLIVQVERALKKASRLDDEREQLAVLIPPLDALKPILPFADRKTIFSAAAHLKRLENEPEEEEAAPAPESEDPARALQREMDAYLPSAADLEFEADDKRIVTRLAQNQFDPVADYQLNLIAQHLSLVSGFEALLCLPLLRGLARKALVLTPPALVSQWREEMRDKFGVEFVTHEDAAFRALGAAAWERFDRVIASLPTAKNATHSAAIHQLTYDVIIVDEAHHLKNRATLNWKFVNGLKSKYLLLLTATPAQNNLDELFNLITLLRPGQLKTLTAFRREFVERGDPRKPKNRTKLRELLMDVMVRNTRSQVSVALPPRRAFTLRVSPSPDERALYDAATSFVRREYGGRRVERFMAHTLQAEVGGSAHALRATLESMRQRHPKYRAALDALHDLTRRVTSSAKADALLQLLKPRSEKMLVFTKYRETQHFLLRTLEEAGVSAAPFSGEMSAAEKDAAVAAFARERQVLVSTDVGSEGRNLQFCHTIVNYDLPWNPLRIEQRVGRVHRIGQTEPVSIFNLAAHDTAEDYILDVLDSKINMFELVVGEIGEILGNLDEDKEFEDIVLDLWATAASNDDARDAFAQLGDQLITAQRKYLDSKAYDDELFGEEFVAEEV